MPYPVPQPVRVPVYSSKLLGRSSTCAMGLGSRSSRSRRSSSAVADPSFGQVHEARRSQGDDGDVQGVHVAVVVQ